jgi:hypothetical protein
MIKRHPTLSSLNERDFVQILDLMLKIGGVLKGIG